MRVHVKWRLILNDENIIGAIHNHICAIFIENRPIRTRVEDADMVRIVNITSDAAGIPILRHNKNGIRVAVTLRIVNSGIVARDTCRSSPMDKSRGAGAEARTAHMEGATADRQGRAAAAGGIHSSARTAFAYHADTA